MDLISNNELYYYLHIYNHLIIYQIHFLKKKITWYSFMTIVQINSIFYTGSTGGIVLYLHRFFAVHKCNTYVIHGRGSNPIETTVFKNCSELESNIHHAYANIFNNEYGGCFFATNKMIRLVKRLKPDVVHLHCCNGYFVNLYRLFNYLKKNNYKVVVTNHGEFYYTGNCGHAFECNKWKSGCGNCPHIKDFNGKLSLDHTHRNWLRMKNALSGFNKNNIVITSVSPWVMSRSEQSPILSSYRHVVVLNGIDISNFIYHDMNEMRKELNLPLGKKIYIFVNSNWGDEAKGQYFDLLVDRLPISLFLVVGAPMDYQFKNNVINLGRINNPSLLSKYYSACNKTLLLSKKETFSLPVAESMCSGTPVVGFYSGGPETISIEEYSQFCEYGNLDELVKLINKEKSFDRKHLSNEARAKYSVENMANGYLDVYKELLSK